jgi:hypothetical protein
MPAGEKGFTAMTQVSRTPRSILMRRTLLALIAVALCLEVAGEAESIIISFGHPVSGTIVGIPRQFAQITSLAFPILPYLSLAMIAGALLYSAMGPTRDTLVRDSPDIPDRHDSRANVLEYVIPIFASGVAGFLVWLPRSMQTLPIGGDTLYYMSVLETMGREGPFWAVSYTDKPLFYLVLYGLQQFTSLSVADFFIVLPVALGTGATVSVWFFVRSFYKEAAGYASLLTATSTALMRTSIDLYASFFATIVLFLTLGIYLTHRNGMQVRQRRILQLVIIVSLLSYWFVWALLLVVIGAAELLSKDRIKQVRQFLSVSLPSIAVMGLFIAFALFRPPPNYWGLGSSFSLYLGKAVTPVGTVTYTSASFDLSDLGLLQYNPVLPILAVIGLLSYRPRTFPSRAIYIWTSIMLSFSLISTTGLHAALLIPLPVLAGIGVRKMLETI